MQVTMLDEMIQIFYGGGAVAYPLFVGCGILSFAICKRLLVLRESGQEYEEAISNLKKSHTKEEREQVILNSQVEFSQYNTLITTVVMIAPLLGLLGTVGGMIETFASLGGGNLYSQSGGIAGGISQALISTQMGLAVAIPGVIIGRLLNKKQSKLLNEIYRVSEEVKLKVNS